MKTDDPFPVLTRLRKADRDWQKQRAAVLLLRWWKWPVLVVTAMLVADVVFHLEGRHRLGLDILLIAACLGSLVWLLHFALWHRNPPERTARLLESREPELGSKLINLLHLHDKFLAAPETSPLTRELAEQAVQDASHGVAHVPFLPLAKEPGMRRAGWQAVVPSLVFGVLALGFAPAFLATVVRYLDPAGDHPPYSLTRLWIAEPAGDDASVLYGGSLMVKARWLGHDPKELFISAYPPGKPEQVTTVPMMPQEPGLFAQQLENVRTDLVLQVHTKGRWSTSAHRRVAVVLTPRFEHAQIAMAPPAYTGLPEKSAPFTFNGATALSGSRVTITLQSNRPLKEGRLQLATASGTPQTIALKADDPRQPGQVRGSFIATDSGRMTFGLEDIAGIPSDEVKTSAFTVTHDLPPSVSIVEPARDGYLVEGFPMTARITATDDYGLKSLRIHVLRFDKALRPVEKMYQDITLKDTVDLPLGDLFVPPLHADDIVSFFAEAVDNHPDPPHVTRSEVRRLQVINQGQYNDFLREEHSIADLEAKYDELFQDFQKLLQQQKALAEAAAETEKQQAAKPNDEALKKQQEQQRKEQEELNQKLTQAAEKMENFTNGNPLYDVEKDFQQMLNEQAQQVKDSVAKNRDAMQSPGSSVAKAAAEHHERMAGAEKQTEKQINQALADASRIQDMMDDFNHFQELYQQQEQLTQQMSAYREDPGTNENNKLAMQSLGAEQREIGSQLQALEQKLRADAEANKDKLPKASRSCLRLADAMNDAHMERLASQASTHMIKADGRRGHAGADLLREQMAGLFGECKGGQGNASEELDQALSLSHCNKPGATGRQMSMSRKFGRSGRMMGRGGSMGGFMNSSDPGGGSHSVYGMESKLGRVHSGAGEGEAQDNATSTAQPVITSGPITDGPHQVNRSSDTVPATTILDQYRSLTDAYFNRITGPKKEEKKP